MWRLRKRDATLDCTKYNCSLRDTDGEELRNNQVFSVDRSIVAVIFVPSREAADAVAGILPPAQNLGTIGGSGGGYEYSGGRAGLWGIGSI